MNVVIYARYSCERQTEQSIEGQLRECEEFAEKHDMTIVDTYIDRAISGTSTNHREAFLKMIADSEKHTFEGVLMYKMDRFARNRYDSAVYKAKLKKNGVRVYYAKEQIPEGPEGIILESLLEGMAEYYSAELSQKIKRGMRENALKGKATGGSTAIGYKITPDKTFAIDEDYADVVRHIFRSYARGERVEDICRDLNEKGIRTPRGCLFNPSSMRKMLQNEKYIGVYVCKDIRLEDAIPPIIDKSLFHEVQQILAKNRKAPARAKAKVDYLLSGKAYCGKCGNGLVGESSNPNSDSGPHYYYKCANRKKGLGCDKKTIRKEELENLVAQKVAEVVLRPEKIKEIAQRCEEMQRDMVRTIRNPEADMLKKQLEKTKKSIANIMMAMEQGIFTKSTKEHLEALEQRKETLEIEIQRTSMVEKVDIITADQIEFMLLQFLPEANTDVTAYADDIISCFVHSVYLWDDSCAIWLNLSNQQPKPHKNRCAKVTPESTQRLQLSVDLLSGNVKKNLVQKNAGENSHLKTSPPPHKIT